MIDPTSGTQLELNMTAGMATKAQSTLLIERAVDYLRGGPASSASLVASVCQLSAVPPMIADHLAVTLLREHTRFIRTADGGWRLGEPASPAWRTQVADDEPLLSSLSFAVVDVETTGGQSHLNDRITEIAIVTVRDGRVQEVYETLVNPERSIPPFVSRLTNITWDMVRDKAPFRGVCDAVLRALEGHVFVAHNASFDWRFVSTEVVRATGRQLTGRRLCTVRLARRVLPQLRRQSLDWLAMYYGVEIPHGQRHRAGGDAIATAQCLIRLLEDAQSHGCTKWSELERFLATGASGLKRRKKRKGQLAMPHSVSKDTTA